MRKRKKNRGGRPTKFNSSTVGKLEQAATADFSVSEMCLFVGINRDTFYEWEKKYPEFSDRLELLRNTPSMLAKQSILKALQIESKKKRFIDTKFCIDYLARKRKDEFSLRSEVTGKDGNDINKPDNRSTEEILAEIKELDEKIKAAMNE